MSVESVGQAPVLDSDLPPRREAGPGEAGDVTGDDGRIGSQLRIADRVGLQHPADSSHSCPAALYAPIEFTSYRIWPWPKCGSRAGRCRSGPVVWGQTRIDRPRIRVSSVIVPHMIRAANTPFRVHPAPGAARR
jgi:hypothetical protein